MSDARSSAAGTRGALSSTAFLLYVAAAFVVFRVGTTYDTYAFINDPLTVSYLSKAVKGITFLLLALVMHRAATPAVFKACGLGAGAVLVLYVVVRACVAVLGAFDPSIAMAQAVLAGAHEAMVTFALLALMATGSLRACFCACAGANAVYFLLLGGSYFCGSEVQQALEIVGRLGGTAVVLWAVLRTPWAERLFCGAAEVVGGVAHARVALPTTASFALCVALSAVLTAMTGVLAGASVQMSGQGVFNASVALVSALLCALFLGTVAMGRAAGTVGISLRLVVPVLVVYLLGALLVPLVTADGQSVGAGLIKVGRHLLMVVCWCLVLNDVALRRSGALMRLGIMSATMTYAYSAPLSSLLASQALEPLELSWGALAVVAACALGCAAFGLRGTGDHSVRGAGAEDAVDVRLRRFDAQLRAFIGRHDYTERETDVLVEVVHGWSIEAAGRRLGLSKDAAKFALLKVYAKAGVSGKQELVQAIEETVVDEPIDI